jgi:hypothetical protein
VRTAIGLHSWCRVEQIFVVAKPTKPNSGTYPVL